MKTFKMEIFNDRNVPMRLSIQNATKEPWDHEHLVIDRLQSREVEIEIPDGSIPYFKVWETGQALLSYRIKE